MQSKLSPLFPRKVSLTLALSLRFITRSKFSHCIIEMDHEKSYVFSSDRPSKRRRVEKLTGLDSSWALRERLYRELWNEQIQRVNDVLNRSNEATLEEILAFLKEARDVDEVGRLPAGFVLAGPSIAAHSSIFEQLEQRTSEEIASNFILVSASEAPNLKTLLKAVIKTGTSQSSFDDELSISKRSGRKLLDYDLQLLYDWVKERGITQIVVAFRDCEPFDSAVLSEAIELLGYALSPLNPAATN